MNTPQPERAVYLDWLRVFATAAVFLFHCARFFDADGWHVKSARQSPVATGFVVFSVQWLMPLFFLVSGASVWLSLGRRAPGEFVRERLWRLGLPFVFGVFVLIPPQVYLERLSQGRFEGSFVQFLPHYFEGWYGFGGNFAWMGLHLWYLLMLLLCSLLALPVLHWLRGRVGSVGWSRVACMLGCAPVLYLLALPAAVLELTLDPKGLGRRDFGGWSLVIYLWIFLVGCLLCAAPTAWETIRRRRWFSLGLALVTMSLLLGLWHWEETEPAVRAVMVVLRAYHSWFWLLAFVGLAMSYLSQAPRWLRSANQAVLPFYMLHQTVILVVGYQVLKRDWNLAVEFAVICAVSLSVIVGLYTLLIRRVTLLRVLFGLKRETRL
jgi:glucan biosynthesis protein C